MITNHYMNGSQCSPRGYQAMFCIIGNAHAGRFPTYFEHFYICAFDNMKKIMFGLDRYVNVDHYFAKCTSKSSWRVSKQRRGLSSNIDSTYNCKTCQ